MKLFKKAKKGFTLVELVVVIAVIAILAAVSVGAYFGVTDSANRSKLEQEAKQAYTNIQLVSLVDSKDGFDLDIDGLSIDELGDFQREVAKAGGDYVFTDSYDAIDDEKPTIVLNTQAVSTSNTTSVYKQFDYYIPTISGMHANCNILNGGKITIVKGDNPAFGDIENSETPDAPTPEEPDHVCSFNNNGPTCDDPNCNEPNPDYVAPNPVTGVSITNKPSSALVLNTTNKNTYPLYAEAVVSDSTKDTTDTFSIEWSTDNSGHATVNADGLVTAVSDGETVVTATIKVGDVIKGTDTVIINVEKPEVLVEITTTKRNYYIGEDNDVTFTVSVTSEETLSDYGVIWSTNNDEITISNDGKIVFGETIFSDLVVTATSKIDPNAQDTITISLDKKLTNIEISEENKNVELKVGEPVDLSAFINTNGANIGTDLTYESNNDAVTVDGSIITANTYVTDTITVTVSNEFANNSFNVSIKNPINSLVITDGSNVLDYLTLTLGDSLLGTKGIAARLTKNYGNESPTISWSATSNAATCPISITNPTSTNATVTAVAVGTATLKVTATLNSSTESASIPVEVVDYDTLTIEQANQITDENQREEIYYLSGYILNWEEYNPQHKYTGNRSYILVDDLSNPTTANKLKVWESSVNGTFDNSYNYQPNETTHFESLGYNIGDKLTLKCVIANTNNNGIYAEGNILTDRSVKTNLTVKATCVNGGDIPLTTTDNVVYSYTDLDVHGGDEISISYSYTDGSPVNKVVDIATSDANTTNYVASADGKLSFTFNFSTQEFTPTFVANEDVGGNTPSPDIPSDNFTEKIATLTFNDVNKRTEFSTTVQVWEEDGIVFTNNKGSSTSNVGDYANPVRIYKFSNVIISLKDGADKITQIDFECNVKDKKMDLSDLSGLENNGTVYTYKLNEPCNEVSFSAKGGQIQIASIKVYFNDYNGGNTEQPSVMLDRISINPNEVLLNLTDNKSQAFTISGTGSDGKDFDISDAIISYSYNTNIISVENNTITAKSVGSDTITVKVKIGDIEKSNTINVTVKDSEEPSNALSNVEIDFSSTAHRVSQDGNKQVWQNNGLTFTNNKGGSSSAVVGNVNPVRLYANSQLVFEGVGLKTIVVYCNSTNYATALKNSFNGNDGAVVTVSSKVVTIKLNEVANKFTVNSLNAQVRVDKLVVNPQ